MNVSIIKKLDSKTKEELLFILEGVLSIKGIPEFINLNYLASTADKLKLIKKSFTKFLKRTSFHDYHKAIQFFDDLTKEVLVPLENLIEASPKEAASFLQEVVNSFSKLVESKDDSSGCAVEFFSKTLELWGSSWKYMNNKDINKLAQLVGDIYLNHPYIDNEIIYHFRPALGRDGLITLEKYLGNDKYGLLYTIELQNDPDKYIKFIEDNHIKNVESYFKIASMLIEDFRPEEATAWLNKIPDNTKNQEQYTIKQDLLIKAQQEEGNIKEVQKIRWEAFNKTLNPKYYLDYIKYASPEEAEQIRKSAIDIAYQNSNFNAALYFLESIEEYAIVGNMI
ncbi:MAG: hypothetical protein K0R94_1548, partial [Burkholderiales bacterium]|nr:hypothetical protein [Burkholderiales bacterium]